MMLVEETSSSDLAMPVEQLKRHMRTGTGFVQDDLQDDLLASFLRAAMAAIESRTGKALLQRTFALRVNQWTNPDQQPLPIAPVLSIIEIKLIRPNANAAQAIDEQIVDPQRYRLEMDTQTPGIRGNSGSLPSLVNGAVAEIRFEAGMAASFERLPADIVQAVLLLASHYDEYRNDVALGQGCMPFGVTSLIARYCPMRLGFSS